MISILIQVRSTKRTPAVVNGVFRLQHLFGRHSILQMELLIVMYLLRFGVCVCARAYVWPVVVHIQHSYFLQQSNRCFNIRRKLF